MVLGKHGYICTTDDQRHVEMMDPRVECLAMAMLKAHVGTETLLCSHGADVDGIPCKCHRCMLVPPHGLDSTRMVTPSRTSSRVLYCMYCYIIYHVVCIRWADDGTSSRKRGMLRLYITYLSWDFSYHFFAYIFSQGLLYYHY